MESSGIFVKNIVPGSAAEYSGQIKVHDKIIAVSTLFFNLLCLALQNVTDSGDYFKLSFTQNFIATFIL